GTTESGAAPVAATSLIDSIEAIEDPRVMFRRNPDARVLHDHTRRSIGSFDMDFNRPSVRRILDGVVDQVEEHLPKPRSVSTNLQGTWLGAMQSQPFAFRQQAHCFSHPFHERRQIHLFTNLLGNAGVFTGKS